KPTGPSPVATTSNSTPSHGTTATATPNATATTIAVATVQAQVTATAGVIKTATAGNAAYTDPLNDPNRPATQNEQWQQNNNCAFKPDGYHVVAGGSLLGRGALQGCLESATQYANFAITVDATILGGHTGGLFFRVQPQTEGAYSGYLFEIDTNGNYKISLSKN